MNYIIGHLVLRLRGQPADGPGRHGLDTRGRARGPDERREEVVGVQEAVQRGVVVQL